MNVIRDANSSMNHIHRDTNTEKHTRYDFDLQPTLGGTSERKQHNNTGVSEIEWIFGTFSFDSFETFSWNFAESLGSRFETLRLLFGSKM